MYLRKLKILFSINNNWVRFEFGKKGNPHAHGPDNPHFDTVLKDEASRAALRAAGRRDVEHLDTWSTAEKRLSEFFDQLASHPPFSTRMEGCSALSTIGPKIDKNRSPTIS